MMTDNRSLTGTRRSTWPWELVDDWRVAEERDRDVIDTQGWDARECLRATYDTVELLIAGL